MATQAPAKAKLKSLGSDGTEIVVHFNPASMAYSVENSTPQQSGDPRRRQFAAQFTGKLTMDLQFDTTDTGDDVRQYTHKVASFMQASAAAQQQASGGGGGSNQNPPQAQPVLSFEWGSYQFKGVMDSFKETIDFFSADGVPLRALVSISLSRQDQVFDDTTEFSGSNTSGSLVPTSGQDSAQSAATRGGDPKAARQLASDNGLESLRFTAGASLEVNAGVQLKAAAGFVSSASAGAGASAGFGLGISAGAGVSVGGGAGISIGAGASGGGALFGGHASAGVSARAGAFAGLETGRAAVSSTTRLNPMRMLPATAVADVSAHAGASFSLGGSANNQSSAGLSSDVGASFSFSDRLTFDFDD